MASFLRAIVLINYLHCLIFFSFDNIYPKVNTVVGTLMQQVRPQYLKTIK